MARLIRQQRLKLRVRKKIKASLNGRPRLCVHATGRHIYAQVIAEDGRVLASASTKQANVASTVKSTAGVEGATAVGKGIAEAAKQAKVNEVVFDRGRFPYHGRIKALAEAARAGGMKF